MTRTGAPMSALPGDSGLGVTVQRVGEPGRVARHLLDGGTRPLHRNTQPAAHEQRRIQIVSEAAGRTVPALPERADEGTGSSAQEVVSPTGEARVGRGLTARSTRVHKDQRGAGAESVFQRTQEALHE